MKMQQIVWIHLPETDSTNTYLHHYKGEEGSLMTVVSTDFQTAGRGQGSNHWESEQGKNLTFSVKIHPQGVPVNRQFIMLEAGSLALKDVLSQYSDDISIKWPNDIYWRDYKISGTLSECTISGNNIKSCIFGTGLNVNQKTFISDAPNPISLFQIIGKEIELQALLKQIINRMAHYIDLIDKGLYQTIDAIYHQSLYRLNQWHTYIDSEGNYEGKITGITPLGHLCIIDKQNRSHTYAFKEVKFVIE